MNRAERRRQQRDEEKQEVRYTYSNQELQQIKQKERETACEFAFLYMMHFSVLALRDEFKFGKQRLEKFVEKVFESYRCFDSDYVKVEDIRQTMIDEVGIDIVLEGMKQLEKK